MRMASARNLCGFTIDVERSTVSQWVYTKEIPPHGPFNVVIPLGRPMDPDCVPEMHIETIERVLIREEQKATSR